MTKKYEVLHNDDEEESAANGLIECKGVEQYSVTIISAKSTKMTVSRKLKHLKQSFRSGYILESFEEEIDLPTLLFNLNSNDLELNTINNDHPKFTGTEARFEEVSVLFSRLESEDKKCFLILGFQIPGDENEDYFVARWKEFSGLPSHLLFLSKSYFVKRVTLLRNVDPQTIIDSQFKFLVIFEVHYRQEDLIYLLQYVQNNRTWRNVGFISVYGLI